MLFFLGEERPPWSCAQSALCTENYWSEKATGDEEQISHAETTCRWAAPPAHQMHPLQRPRMRVTQYSPVPQHPLSQQWQGWRWVSGTPGREEEDGSPQTRHSSNGIQICLTNIFSPYMENLSDCRKILGMKTISSEICSPVRISTPPPPPFLYPSACFPNNSLAQLIHHHYMFGFF